MIWKQWKSLPVSTYRTILVILLAVSLQPPGAQAMEVQVIGRDTNGDTVLRSGDLTTPIGLMGGMSSKTVLALTGQGVGPIFGNVLFPQSALPLVTYEPPVQPPTQPLQVKTALEWVPEPSQISYGLSFGGIANPLGIGTAPPSSQSTQVSGHFTLDGTATVVKANKLMAFAGPKPNPLPGTVGLFLTGLGAGLGALRLMRQRARSRV